jgi:hypothetical protein
VVILRKLPCEDVHTGEKVNVDDVVSVYGPFTLRHARERAEQFNLVHDEADDGAPIYRPVRNAPAFLHQESWIEHWAIVRPMNDITW